MRTIRATSAAPLVALLATLVSPTVPAGPQPTTPVAKKDPVAAPLLPCPDLAIKLSVAKTITGGNGVLTLNGSICNLGGMDYVVPPASPVEAEYLVRTWHPPKTAVQEKDVRQLAHQSVGSRLNASGFITYTQTYTIPNVTRWDNPLAMKGERPVVKEFVLRLNKRYPQGDRFTTNEDCNADNNTVALDVPYMEGGP